MATWTSTLLRVETIAHDTNAFYLSKPDGFTYTAGQTLSLSLPGGEKPLRHTFSLVSAPYENDLCLATRMRQSPFKQTLAALDPGTEIAFSGPYGKFGLPEDTGRPLLLIAGGIGITPYISMLRTATHAGSTQRFRLLYSNRHPRDAAFLEELQALTGLNPYFQLMATCTGESDESWTGLRGRIDQAMLNQALQSLSEPLCYVTGAPDMVETVTDLLTRVGVPDADIRSEGFHGY